MNHLNQEIQNELIEQGAKYVQFVNISQLTEAQNRKLPHAIVFALPLTAKYVKEVMDTPDYVKARIEDNFNFADDEYVLTEHRTGELADQIAAYLMKKGYKAFSQSDQSLLAEGKYDVEHKKSLLPNKMIALMGGLGWIGKNNLLVTPGYGAAQCLGTLLTDAPLETVLHEPLMPKCGNCHVCVDICESNVLKGKSWDVSLSRDEIIDVYGCNPCMKCMAHCPRTQTYVKKNL